MEEVNDKHNSYNNNKQAISGQQGDIRIVIATKIEVDMIK